MKEALRSILLQPRNPGPNIAAWSARPRRIAVIAERAEAWIGRPVANPKCPTLLWPKCAWVEVPPKVVIAPGQDASPCPTSNP